MTAKDVLHRAAKNLLWKQGVQAVGLGYKQVNGQVTTTHCIMVSVRQKLPKSQLAASDVVPTTLDGIPTDVVETGEIRALAATDRHRPAPGGVSIGHYSITAGTLGCLVKRGGDTFILSNNHVLAASNRGQVGDDILQPGTFDGGDAGTDKIAELEEFVEIHFGGTPDDGSKCKFARGITVAANLIARMLGSDTRLRAVRPFAQPNLVDAAIARPVQADYVEDTILGIAPITGVAEATLGALAQKSGRTTGFQAGRITQTDVVTRVSYGDAGNAVFEDQFMVGRPGFSAGGDSGSAILDKNYNLVGLLFAGSDQVTICNRIQNVFALLQVTR